MLMAPLPFPEKLLASHVAILAKTGAGKSYLCQGIAEHLLAKGERVCLIDPTDRYWGLRMGPRGGKSGLDITIFGGDRGDVALQPNHGHALAEIVGRSATSTIISTKRLSKDNRARFAADFFERLLAVNQGILHLVIDEAHLFAPQQGSKAAGFTPRMLAATNEICSSGRGMGICIIMVTQRPAKFHNDALSCAETLIPMRMWLPHDIEQVKDWVKHWASLDQAKELLASIPQLPTGEGWVWAPEQGILKRIAVPRINTYDSGAPGASAAAPNLQPMDLGAIEAKLAKAGEAVLAEDPRAIQQRVRQLEAEIKTLKSVPAEPGATEAELRDRHAQGVRVGEETLRRQATALLRSLSGELIKDIQGRIDDAVKKLDASKAPIETEPQAPRRVMRRADTMASAGNPKVAAATGARLSKAERKILTALAQYPQGRTKGQVAVLAAYSSSGGGFNNALGALRSAGRISGSGEMLIITDIGVADLGPFDPLPTGRALLDFWLPQLSKAEREALIVLVDHYPEYMEKAAIAEQTPTGYEPDGGGFNNALGRLRTLELITRDPQNGIRASDNLFG
jgi:hypothetical protein